MSAWYRLSASLVCWFGDGRVTVVSYRSGKAFRCAAHWIPALAACSEPQPEREVLRLLRARGGDGRAHLERLLSLGVLVELETAAAKDDEDWRHRWHWGPVAGLYHYATRDVPWATPEQETEHLRRLAAAGGEPALWEEHPRDARTTALPTAGLGSDLLRLARRRESWRDLADEPVPLAAVADCLYAGLGIRGYLRLPLRPVLPLKLTPSAGARNPYEGYLLARAVQGLRPGAYHYAGCDHSLRRLSDQAPPPLGGLLGSQSCFDHAAALLVLVARLERPMHKYRAPSGYGSVLIEAGHIAQNMVLVATTHRLGTATSAALDHSALERVLGIDDPLHAAVYVVVLGMPRGPDRRGASAQWRQLPEETSR